MATKRRKVVGPEGRAIIASVYRFLRQEYEFTKLYMEPNCDLTHLRDITRRTAEATGVSTKSVQRILKEEKALLPSSPEPEREHTPPIKKGKSQNSNEEDSNNEDDDSTKNGDIKNENSISDAGKAEDVGIETKIEIQLEHLTGDVEVKQEPSSIEKVKNEPLSDVE